MWPVANEAVLSITWAYLFVVLSTFWVVTMLMGHPAVGVNSFPECGA